MSRRDTKIEKRVTLDPKYNSELVAHMIRVVMKDGKKTVAERIVYGAIDKVAEEMKADPSKFVKDEKTYEDPLEVISAAIDAMKPQVEAATAWECRRLSQPRLRMRSWVRAVSSRSATTCTRWRRRTRRSRTTPGKRSAVFPASSERRRGSSAAPSACRAGTARANMV